MNFLCLLHILCLAWAGSKRQVHKISLDIASHLQTLFMNLHSSQSKIRLHMGDIVLFSNNGTVSLYFETANPPKSFPISFLLALLSSWPAASLRNNLCLETKWWTRTVEIWSLKRGGEHAQGRKVGSDNQVEKTRGKLGGRIVLGGSVL